MIIINLFELIFCESKKQSLPHCHNMDIEEFGQKDCDFLILSPSPSRFLSAFDLPDFKISTYIMHILKITV